MPFVGAPDLRRARDAENLRAVQLVLGRSKLDRQLTGALKCIAAIPWRVAIGHIVTAWGTAHPLRAMPKARGRADPGP